MRKELVLELRLQVQQNIGCKRNQKPIIMRQIIDRCYKNNTRMQQTCLGQQVMAFIIKTMPWLIPGIYMVEDKNQVS